MGFIITYNMQHFSPNLLFKNWIIVEKRTLHFRRNSRTLGPSETKGDLKETVKSMTVVNDTAERVETYARTIYSMSLTSDEKQK